MSRTRLIQLSGLAGIVGGVLLILLDVAFIVTFGDQPERVAAATTTWLILLDLSIIAGHLGLLGLIGQTLFRRIATVSAILAAPRRPSRRVLFR